MVQETSRCTQICASDNHSILIFRVGKMVVARNSKQFYALAKQFFKANHIEEGEFAKYRRWMDDYVYKLIKDDTWRIFRMYYTDLIVYDEETRAWRVTRYPTVTTVSWFNEVARAIGLPVSISVNHFYIKVCFRDLYGEPTKFYYELPREIKSFSFKDNKDLAKLVSNLHLRPYAKERKIPKRYKKPEVPKGYKVEIRKYHEIDLRRVLDYLVGTNYDEIKVKGQFGTKMDFVKDLGSLEKLWITRFLLSKPLNPNIIRLIEMFYEIDKSEDESKFMIKTSNHKICVRLGQIASITVYEYAPSYWGRNWFPVWSGFALSERSLLKLLMQLLEKYP